MMKADTIRTIGVAGAGTMGLGIAQLFATAGYDVVLYDVNEDVVKKAVQRIDESLSIAVQKGKTTDDQKTSTLVKIKTTTSVSELKGELIIEAIIEDEKAKQKLFASLEEINSVDTILASNTSSISITKIARYLNHPTRVVGLHFFNPAPVMKLVEIIRGAETAPEVAEVLRVVSERIGKIAVIAQDSPGFIVNRVARHYYVEALRLLEEGVSDVTTIDALMRSAGFKMGPFELMDLIGVDTNFAVTQSIYHAFHQDGKFRPSRIQEQKVDAGHIGRKSGKGFYNYDK